MSESRVNPANPVNPVKTMKSSAPNERSNVPGSIAEPTFLFVHFFSDWDFVDYLTQALREAELIDDETQTSANDIYDRIYRALEGLIDVSPWQFYTSFCVFSGLLDEYGLDHLINEMREGYTDFLTDGITWQDVVGKIVELVEEATNES